MSLSNDGPAWACVAGASHDLPAVVATPATPWPSGGRPSLCRSSCCFRSAASILAFIARSSSFSFSFSIDSLSTLLARLCTRWTLLGVCVNHASRRDDQEQRDAGTEGKQKIVE